MRVEIRRTPTRYEAVVDGEIAGFLAYQDAGGVREMPHTVIEPEHGGRGIASRLAKTALDDARDDGVRVRPTCTFVAGYVQKHPEYADLAG